MGNPIGFCVNNKEQTEEVKEEYRHDLVDTQNEAVNHPSHYTYGSIETIDMIESCGWLPHFCAGNALKYLTRHEHKGKKIEDLEKADWYITKLIEFYKKEEEKNKTKWQEVDSAIVKSDEDKETLENKFLEQFYYFLNYTFNDYYNYTSNFTKQNGDLIVEGTSTSLIKFNHDDTEVTPYQQALNLFKRFIIRKNHEVDWENSFIKIDDNSLPYLHIYIKYSAGPENMYLNDDIIILPKDNQIIYPELIKIEKETK